MAGSKGQMGIVRTSDHLKGMARVRGEALECVGFEEISACITYKLEEALKRRHGLHGQWRQDGEVSL